MSDDPRIERCKKSGKHKLVPYPKNLWPDGDTVIWLKVNYCKTCKMIDIVKWKYR